MTALVKLQELKQTLVIDFPAFSNQTLLHVSACSSVQASQIFVQGQLSVTRHYIGFKGLNELILIDFKDILGIDLAKQPVDLTISTKSLTVKKIDLI